MSDVPTPAPPVLGATDHECPACLGAGWTPPVLAPQPPDPAIARDFLCQRCHGTGRVHDAEAEYVLAMYASIDPPYSPPALKTLTSTTPGEQLYRVTFDALPTSRFRAMARTGAHAVTRIKEAAHLSRREIRTFAAHPVF